MTKHTPPPRDSLFRSVQREATLSTRVIRQIEDLVLQKKLTPGDRLPSERDLAEQLGVSRTVVREAIRSLVARGLLEVRPGIGATVRQPSAATVSESVHLFLRTGGSELTYPKVHEIRRVLEIEIAGLAAERRTTDDLAHLEAILDEMSAIGEDRERFAESDVNFHAALADATQNELFSLLLDSIADIMLEVRYSGFELAGAPERALHYHRAIYAQVKAGDPEGARDAMREHLKEAEETQRWVWERQANPTAEPPEK